MTTVAELTGADLALWVARALKMVVNPDVCQPDDAIFVGEGCGDLVLFAPHEDWAQGGPIIEGANISLSPPTSPVHRNGGPNGGNGSSGYWSASTWTAGVDGRRSLGIDKGSPLVAAMRCYVRSVYGDTVPDEVAP